MTAAITSLAHVAFDDLDGGAEALEDRDHRSRLNP